MTCLYILSLVFISEASEEGMELAVGAVLIITELNRLM